MNKRPGPDRRKSSPDVPKSLPCAPDGEKGVLCSAILNPREVIDVVRAQLPAEAFYAPAHRIIYELVLEFGDQGKPIDFITLKQSLQDRGQLEEAGGVELLNELYGFVPTADNAAYYATMVREKHLLREAILGAQRVIGLAQDDGAAFGAVRDEIEKVLTACSEVQTHEPTLRELTLDWHASLAERAERLKRQGFYFGIPSVDRALGPIRPGDFVVVSAETSGGKSLFAFQGALHAAAKGLPVAAFSLEMSNEQLWDRMFAHLSKVSMRSFREGLFTAEEIERLNHQIPRFVDLPLYIGQTRGNDISGIASKLRRLKVKHGIKVAVVDYLQRVRPSTIRRDGARYLEVAEVSDRLKSLAMELDLVMLAPVQLNRDGYTREAASIEHDCDLHLKLIEPDKGNPSEVQLLVVKHRQGARRMWIDLTLDGEYMTLRERKSSERPKCKLRNPFPDED